MFRTTLSHLPSAMRVCMIICANMFCAGMASAQKDTSDLTFSGTRIDPYHLEFDTTGHIVFSAYVDTYCSYYRDSTGTDYSKFPTIAPRDQQIGINIVQASARYYSNDFRGTITVFGGDCPRSSWSSQFNFIQEANAGFRIARRIWIDAGFFRTHIGLESIQPRENITMSLATTTYFEPYFLGGAKLTWHVSEKLALQANVFNSFNTFIETNKNKAFGFSLAFTPNAHHSIAFSSITCDESSDTVHISHQRLYNNLQYTYKSKRFVIGLEANFGMQENSVLNDSSGTAIMYSALAAVKYRITPSWAIYGRGEIYRDPDEILTGPVENGHHQLVGLDIDGFTAGIEYKPIPNSYLRLESRYLQTTAQEDIFYYQGHRSHQRQEVIVGLGVWF